MKNWMQNILKLIQDIYHILTQLNNLKDQLSSIDSHLRLMVESMKIPSETALLHKESKVSAVDFHADMLLLDIKDVIKILNISTATYYRLVKQGELIPRRKGKRHYYYQEDLQRQLEESKRRGRL